MRHGSPGTKGQESRGIKVGWTGDGRAGARRLGIRLTGKREAHQQAQQADAHRSFKTTWGQAGTAAREGKHDGAERLPKQINRMIGQIQSHDAI